MPDIPATTIALARDAVRCDSCFADGRLQRAGIEMPQPYSVGADYWSSPVRLVVIGINPGSGKAAPYKQSRRDALERFVAGDDTALGDYFRNADIDVPHWGNRRFLTRLNAIGLNLREITIGNIALCATKGNRYPSWMLDACFVRHVTRWMRELDPDAVLLMGSATQPFLRRIQEVLNPQGAAFKMAHFAHREGHTIEQSERVAVRSWLAGVRHGKAGQ